MSSPTRNLKKTQSHSTVIRTSTHIIESRADLDDRTATALENQRLLIENENLKNILNGLNEKLTVSNDVKNDLEQHKKMYNQSESSRLGLHNQMKLVD